MVGQTPNNSVWSAMSYVPPKGRCNFKTSLMSPGCPCLRFMLHPVKAATSFDCDGCNHHASFHSLENPAEDAVLQRWAEQESASAQAPQAISGTNKKRKMITQTAVNCNDDAAILRASSATGNRGSARRKAPMPKNKAESRISTAKSDGIEDSERKLYEIVDGEMVLQEWD